MQSYNATEVSNYLKIKPTTLRKYCVMLEKEGYLMARNDQSHRYYNDEDIMTLESILKVKRTGLTLQESIKTVINKQESVAATEDDCDVDRGYNRDILEELKVTLNEQNSMLENQAQMITELTKQVQQQQKQFDELMYQNNGLKDEQESKSMWGRLFKGN